MRTIIGDYLDNPINDKTTYNKLTLIRINKKKDFDKILRKELQEELILSYADKEFYDFQFENATEQEIKDYIINKIPALDTTLNKNVSRGDFGEVFCRLVSEYFYGRTCYNKLKFKFNHKKSVFGTDVLSFDDINNPKSIRYYEVKTRDVLRKESPKKGEPSIYISIIAHDSLYNDYTESFNTVLDFMVQRMFEEKKYDQARIFRDINSNKLSIKKAFELFFITEDKTNKVDEILQVLNDLPPKIPELSFTIIVINNLYDFIDETWNSITDKAVEMFGDNNGQN